MPALDKLVQDPAQPAISPVILRKAAKVEGERAGAAAEVFRPASNGQPVPVDARNGDRAVRVAGAQPLGEVRGGGEALPDDHERELPILEGANGFLEAAGEAAHIAAEDRGDALVVCALPGDQHARFSRPGFHAALPRNPCALTGLMRAREGSGRSTMLQSAQAICPSRPSAAVTRGSLAFYDSIDELATQSVTRAVAGGCESRA